MKAQNTFKKGNQPAKDAISATIGRDARPTRRLNPPIFEDAKIDFWNPNIMMGQSVKKYER